MAIEVLWLPHHDTDRDQCSCSRSNCLFERLKAHTRVRLFHCWTGPLGRVTSRCCPVVRGLLARLRSARRTWSRTMLACWAHPGVPPLDVRKHPDVKPAPTQSDPPIPFATRPPRSLRDDSAHTFVVDLHPGIQDVGNAPPRQVCRRATIKGRSNAHRVAFGAPHRATGLNRSVQRFAAGEHPDLAHPWLALADVRHQPSTQVRLSLTGTPRRRAPDVQNGSPSYSRSIPEMARAITSRWIS